MAFSSLARIFFFFLGGEVIHSLPALFSFLFCLFIKWRSACAHRFHILGQDQSTVAQRVKTTVAECSLTSGV